MEIILNRLRGTSGIGAILYAIYLGLMVYFFTEYYYGIITFILFLIGKSFGWGKWVGALTSKDYVKAYNDLEGYDFPYIHHVSNFFIKEKKDYLNYCRLALSLRGFIWWTPMLVLFGYIDLLSWYQVAINSIILSIGFPIACELSKSWIFEYKSKFLSISGNWEKQEVIYGLFQFICITLAILIYKVA